MVAYSVISYRVFFSNDVISQQQQYIGPIEMAQLIEFLSSPFADGKRLALPERTKYSNIISHDSLPRPMTGEGIDNLKFAVVWGTSFVRF